MLFNHLTGNSLSCRGEELVGVSGSKREKRKGNWRHRSRDGLEPNTSLAQVKAEAAEDDQDGPAAPRHRSSCGRWITGRSVCRWFPAIGLRLAGFPLVWTAFSHLHFHPSSGHTLTFTPSLPRVCVFVLGWLPLRGPGEDIWDRPVQLRLGLVEVKGEGAGWGVRVQVQVRT